MKGMLSLSLALLVCLFADGARAAALTVHFDFSGSTVTMLGGIVQVPPDGSITRARGALGVPALGIATPLAGMASLQGFTMAATVNALTFGNTITGNPSITQGSGPALGTLTPSFAQAVFGTPMQIALAGALNCSGPSCSILSLPVALTGTQNLNLGALPIANLATVGNALISGTFPITFAGLSGSVHLVGTEVSRVFVPEPHTAGLLALGLLALAGWRARGLRR